MKSINKYFIITLISVLVFNIGCDSDERSAMG